ncbi:MAG: FtsW/RodA/SpoVE family cell cycle protein [Paludibacteraceae bacterium]
MHLPPVKNIDRTFWVVYILLIAVAVVALFSASSSLVYKTDSILGPIGSQMLFLAAGVVVAFVVQMLPTSVVRLGGYGLLAFSLLCLYLILIPEFPLAVTRNEATRWIKIGIEFQPSELAKLALIIVVADLLSRIRSEKDKQKYFFWTLGLTAATALPIMIHNLSTAILICGIVFLLWILARIPFKYVGSTAAIAVACLILGYFIVEFAYVRPQRELKGPFSRAVTWVNRIDRKLYASPEDEAAKFEVTDDNRQEVYANVAVARGGKSPLGVLPGHSKERDYLPQAFADYIFAIIVEESGIIGAIFIIVLYMTVLFRACQVSTLYKDYAAMLMVMGLALMLTCQALLSMLVAVGLGPVTGQPLPMISRGGTSVLITSVYFGIIMGVSREQKTLYERQKEVTEQSGSDVPEL